MTRKKRCPFCKCMFYPDNRLGDRQVCCGKDVCKKLRKKRSQDRWVKKILSRSQADTRTSRSGSGKIQTT